MHARAGKQNSYSEFMAILSKVEEILGKESLSNMHMHISGIEYDKNGEKKHMTLKESDFNSPNASIKRSMKGLPTTSAISRW